MNRAQGIFKTMTILYDTIMMGSCHYTFVQTHRMYDTRSEQGYKLWTLSENDVSL